MTETRGPRIHDLVEVRLTGRVMTEATDGRVYVMLRHPGDGSALVELSFATEDVVSLERANV
jgi:hypothetical protein